MKILIITNLYPNSKEPARGVFNKQQFFELAKLCELKVVAPIPWHKLGRVPVRETIDGIDVYHPRYFMIPKIGRFLYGIFFFLGSIGTVRQIERTFCFDEILATWAYPDGFGSCLLAKLLKKPIVIKVHGTDINLYTSFFLRRKMIAWTLSHSNKVIAVNNALKEEIIKIGVTAGNIEVVSNGVDIDLFKPMDQGECRRKLGLPLDKKIILYVGNFAHVKGVDILVNAFGEMAKSRDDIRLILVGDGPLKGKIHSQVKELGMEDMVLFTGRRTHDSIRYYMNASDIFCLPSRNEGCSNVVLEAMACGTPVVATNVGGIPELVNDSKLGMLVAPESARSLANALMVGLDRKRDHDIMALHQSKLTWGESAQKLFQILLVVSKSGQDRNA